MPEEAGASDAAEVAASFAGLRTIVAFVAPPPLMRMKRVDWSTQRFTVGADQLSAAITSSRKHSVPSPISFSHTASREVTLPRFSASVRSFLASDTPP